MAFIDDVKQEVELALQKLDQLPIVEDGKEKSVVDLLKMALKNELEASEIAAIWMPSTLEIDVKLGLARQCGDEAKHYRLIEKRLNSLGFNTNSFSPVAQGYSPLFNYLKTLESTVERVAAGPFAREAIAVKRNVQFIALLESIGDQETALFYKEQVQPDEYWHHNFGLEMLEKYATSPEAEERAKLAIRKTLSIADELREIAIAKVGCAVPGC